MRLAVVVIAALAIMTSACAALYPRSDAARSTRDTSPSPGAGPQINPPDVELSAPSSNAVWALVDNVHLYRSVDRGQHWKERPGPAYPSRFLSFVDDREGWVLSPGSAATQCEQAAATIWHTVDAGTTWQQLAADGIAGTHCKNGIWFSDSKHGFLAAWDPNHRPTVYRTSDGGATWAASTLQDPAYYKSSPGGFTLEVDWIKQLGGTTYLEAYGIQDDPSLPHDNQFVLKSTDGGASWDYVTKVPSRLVVMVTEMRWLDFTSPGSAMESLNDGQQFHQYMSDFTNDAPSATKLVFADTNVGYAVGAGRLQRTLDGGAHWEQLEAPGVVVVTPAASPSPAPA
jgi:photosystem II stability/assembly factor-like uncharacterized protein